MWPFSKSFNPDEDLPDLSGKVMIVTGGSSGIGYATVQHLARHGAKVYMASRNAKKSQRMIAQLQEEGLAPGNGEVAWLELELDDPRCAREAAEEFMRREQRLDVLVNNGAMGLRSESALTSDGIQEAMVANHMSPFVFTVTLLPLLYRTAQELDSDVRVVNVASDGISLLQRGIRYRNLEDFNDEHARAWTPNLARYYRSKLTNVLFTHSLQKKFNTDNVSIIAMVLNPGGVRTEGVRNDAKHLPPVVSQIFSVLIDVASSPPSKGAYASVFAAAAPVVRKEPEVYKAAYLQQPGRIGEPPNRDAKDPALADELWATTVSLLKEKCELEV